ncbi:MAG: alpha/beta hydrolase [Parachlamydiales bacterium]|jgi:pimeloyl-ACP methyl ester carboxylesterase
MLIDHKNPFTACWNESNAKLNVYGDTYFSKLSRKVHNFIFYIPNSILATCLNPRTETTVYAPFKQIDIRGRSFEKEIITPDNVHLCAEVQVADNADTETPTIIAFNPLGSNQGIHDWLFPLLSKRKCNIVTFNYRGLGTTWTGKDMVLDGESVHQYVTKELGTNKNKVHLYGYSLGGYLAAQVKSLHFDDEGKLVGDRPLKSIFSFITEIFCIERFGK